MVLLKTPSVDTSIALENLIQYFHFKFESEFSYFTGTNESRLDIIFIG